MGDRQVLHGATANLRVQRRRLLAWYLAISTGLVAVGIVAALLDPAVARSGSFAGTASALALGIAGLVILRWAPRRLGRTPIVAATACAVAAMPAVIAFHVDPSRILISVMGSMFLSMYLAAFWPPRQAVLWIGTLTAATLGAAALAPTRLLWVGYVVVAAALLGSGAIFGAVGRLLVNAATRDPLTGLRNRAGLDLELRSRPRDRGTRVCLGLLDVDGFKAFNDEHGHPAGDALLRDAAEAWAQQVPRGGILARLGGDEFLVVLPDTDEEDGRAVLEGLARANPVPVSFGVAAGVVSDPMDLYHDADMDLYRAKAAAWAQLPDRLAPLPLPDVLDLLPVPILAVRDGGTVAYVNPCFATLFGVDARNVENRPLHEVLTGGTWPDRSVTVRSLHDRTGQLCEFGRPDGTVVQATVGAARIRWENTLATLVVLGDVTEQPSYVSR